MIMIDAPSLKAHRTASIQRLKKAVPGSLIERTKGGMNTRWHAFIDWSGCPPELFMRAVQTNDYTGLPSWQTRAMMLIGLGMPWWKKR